MVYKENFVAVIKDSSGKILREQGEFITLPFGSEYSILLKNLDSRKAVVSIHIDGNEVTDGKIIVNPNSDCELKGFLKGNKVRRKFKFIEKTDRISEYRGDRPDDGIIRVEVTFEKKYEEVTQKIRWKYEYNDNPWNIQYYTSYVSGGFIQNLKPCIMGESGPEYVIPKSELSNSVQVNQVNCSNDQGITVEGNDVKQDFVYAQTQPLEDQSTVIIIRLKGHKNNQKVQKPVYVKTKLQCKICGKKSKSNNKFCPECGTRL